MAFIPPIYSVQLILQELLDCRITAEANPETIPSRVGVVSRPTKGREPEFSVILTPHYLSLGQGCTLFVSAATEKLGLIAATGPEQRPATGILILDKSSHIFLREVGLYKGGVPVYKAKLIVSFEGEVGVLPRSQECSSVATQTGSEVEANRIMKNIGIQAVGSSIIESVDASTQYMYAPESNTPHHTGGLKVLHHPQRQGEQPSLPSAASVQEERKVLKLVLAYLIRRFTLKMLEMQAKGKRRIPVVARAMQTDFSLPPRRLSLAAIGKGTTKFVPLHVQPSRVREVKARLDSTLQRSLTNRIGKELSGDLRRPQPLPMSQPRVKKNIASQSIEQKKGFNTPTGGETSRSSSSGLQSMPSFSSRENVKEEYVHRRSAEKQESKEVSRQASSSSSMTRGSSRSIEEEAQQSSAGSKMDSIAGNSSSQTPSSVESEVSTAADESTSASKVKSSSSIPTIL